MPTPSSTVRDFAYGWVEDWNDRTKEFLITLGGDSPPPSSTPTIGEEPFELATDKPAATTEQATRPGQARFRFDVFLRYGAKCAVCDIDLKELLDAVHIRPFSDNGSDDPRNGLAMCANHHRAFDSGLFRIEPTSLQVVTPADNPPTPGITVSAIDYLPAKPHSDALEWAWTKQAKDS